MGLAPEGNKIDRISRSLKDFYYVWDLLQQNGVSFVSATQAFDTSTPAGNLMLNVLLSFGQYERELTVERTTAKMLARAQKGLWNGGVVPLGYDYDRDLQLLVINPEESRTIEAIYESFLSHGSLAQTRDEINNAGHRTKPRTAIDESGNACDGGRRPFTHDTIRNVIRNPLYKGCLNYQGASYIGRHQGIIPVDRWELANNVLASKALGQERGLRPMDEHVHLLKGRLKCGDCGSTMTPYPSGRRRRDGKPYLYYACTAVIKYRRHCDCRVRSLPARPLEAALLSALGQMAADRDLLSMHLESGAVADRRAIDAAGRQLNDAALGLEKAELRLTKLVGVFEDAEAVPASLKKRCVELEEERTRHQLEITRLQNRIRDLQKPSSDPEMIVAFLQSLLQQLEPLSLAERKALLQESITRVTVNHSLPSPECVSRRAGSSGSLLRKPEILVDILVESKTPEQGCSGASDGKSVNRNPKISEFKTSGSPTRKPFDWSTTAALLSFDLAPPKLIRW